MSREVYLVGSVPMASATEVFETVSAALGTRIKRLPDGETGERGDWISWLEPVFSEHPPFRKSGEFFRVHATGTGRERYALKPGVDAARRALRQSVLRRYRQAVLCRLQATERCRKDSRRHEIPGRSGAGAFGDLAVPGRLACMPRSIRSTMTRSSARSTRSPRPFRTMNWRSSSTSPPRCLRALNATRRRATAAPRRRCRRSSRHILVDLGNRVPGDIDLLYHLCYGDSGHKHVVEPTDMNDMVEFANRVVATAEAAGAAHSHAGAARPRRRRLFRSR